MIHLSNLDLISPKEIIQNVFSPFVGAVCSPAADEMCQKNNLNFVELVQPFSRLSADAHFRDSAGTSVSVKGLRLNVCDINWRPPQTILARKMLNESVSSAQCEKVKEVVVSSNTTIQIPQSNTWFEQWRETFLTVQFPSDHEFTRHFLCCLIVISSADFNPVETAQQLTKKVQMLQNITPPKLPKWVFTDALNCYVMLHDGCSGDISKAQQGFEGMKATFGENKCFLLQINSQKDAVTDSPDPWLKYLKKYHKTDPSTENILDSAPKTPQDISITQMPNSVVSQLETPPSGIINNNINSPNNNEVLLHPLSPVQDQLPEIPMQQNPVMSTSTESLTLPINHNVWSNESDVDVPHGSWLSNSDLDNLKHFIQDFTIRALIPYAEKQVGVLNDSIANKKSVSKSLLGATKRWFVTNKPGATTAQNAVVYTPESAELQTRKLGDIYFMFGNYQLAFQAYHQAKRDFNADSAWQYYAGALEMAALSAFMQGVATRKTWDYMEEAISTYLSISKVPQFATRATLMSVECLKAAHQFVDAARQLTRMTSEDSDLRSALLLEQAAYCFLMASPPQYRKYAFHAVLAGHRFTKAGQRKHAFRLYKQADTVFANKGWNLAEDHIQYTISKQAITLKKLDEATQCLAHLLRPSSLQSVQQQTGFLREYLATQKTLVSQTNADELLNIAVPKIVQNSIRVLVTSPPAPKTKEGPTPAFNIDINISNFDEEWRWTKLEEMAVQAAAKKQIMIFKPSRSLFTGDSPTIEHPLSVLGEPIEISFMLENPIKPQILFQEIHLLWEFKKESGELFSNRNFFKSGEVIIDDSVISATFEQSIEFNEFEKKRINLRLLPKYIGYLRIVGVAGRISSTVEKSAIWGKLNFDKITFKVNESSGSTFNERLDYDRKLEIQILKPTSSLMVSFSEIPDELLAGEIIPIQMTLKNSGPNVVDDVYVSTENPRCVLMSPQENELPLSMLREVKDLSMDVFNKDKEARKQYVFKVMDSNDNKDQIQANETKIVKLWIQAPYKKGQKSIKVLVYYNVGKDYPKMKYRLVRHVFNFNVNECLSAEANCNIANEETNELGVDLILKNVNQMHHLLMTEVVIGNVYLYCSMYKLDSSRIYYIKNLTYEKVIANNRNLISNDSLNLRCLLEGRSTPNTKNYVEYFKNKLSMFNIKDLEPFEDTVLGMQSLGNFLVKNETKFIPFTQQNISVDDFNNVLNHNNKHMTLCIAWKAVVSDNGVLVRNAFGQHFLELHHLFESNHCPSKQERSGSSFSSQEEVYEIYNFKNQFEKVLKSPGEWSENSLNVANRCMLEELVT